jgi:energy-coupling factor transporter ATP-binding protein EcfA2
VSEEHEIAKLVAAVGQFKPGKPLKHYISHAVFPRFKSIEPGTRIDFQFPLTALVGANGIGKSSVLHALWGMPLGYSTHKFWFATALDPIASKRGEPQRFFYGHWNESYKGIVETRKARIGSKVDYWEPYRLSIPDGMQPLPDKEFDGKDKDRWNPVRRKVIYVNLKATFGSFDRFFYFEDFDKNDELRRVMQLEAGRLKRIKEDKRQSFKLGGSGERLFLNRDLTQAELESVCRILGRTYESARIIKHSLYPGGRGRDVSVVFKRGSEYSEAFAGSGEIAAVRLVVDVMGAEDFSLVLLDEPETSLHPGAQRALLRFLLDQIKLKKLQIVISTHSPEFLSGLPDEAIKVFEDNGKLQARVLPKSSPAAALNRLGKVPENKVRVLVEDPLAEILVMHAIKGLDPGDALRLEIKVSPGGGDFMLAFSGPALMDTGQPVFLLLDGDKRKVTTLSDPVTIPLAENQFLAQRLVDELGVAPKLSLPGGDGTAAHLAAKTQAQRAYLGWAKTHVGYFPRRLPEQVVLEAFEPNQGHATAAPAQVKAAFLRLVTDGANVGSTTSFEILAWAKLKIAKIPADNADILAIEKTLTGWLVANT